MGEDDTHVNCPTCGRTTYFAESRVPIEGEGHDLRCRFCALSFQIGSGEEAISGTIQGDKGGDVAKVATAVISNYRRQKMSIKVVNSAIGVFNAGEINSLDSISTNIATLEKSDSPKIAEALCVVAESVTNNQEVSPEQREELLDIIEEISEQATLETDKRRKTAVIKSLLGGLAMGMGAVGSLAEVWSTWGPAILKFFGLA